MTPVTPLLQVRGLRKDFTARSQLPFVSRRRAPVIRPALVDVSFDLGAGEALGIVGESGSGKTTLARCIVGLEKPDSGEILFAGTDHVRTPPSGSQRRRIQMIFQDPYSSLNPRLTIGSTLAEVLHVHRLAPPGQIRERVATLLDQVGIPADAANRYPRAFSGGQRQRLAIARALAAEPQLLIADEPVSSLDVSIQAQILALLTSLRERLGLSILFVSHNLFVVRYVARSVAVMFGGRIVELLPPEVPLEAARHPYTQALLAAAPRLEPRRSTAPSARETTASTSLPVAGCPYRSRCQYAYEPCATIDPPALPVDQPGHLVACHYVAARLGTKPSQPPGSSTTRVPSSPRPPEAASENKRDGAVP
jgi:oligopeptide/dipeptide ABC transporter ATP-binding protein